MTLSSEKLLSVYEDLATGRVRVSKHRIRK